MAHKRSYIVNLTEEELKFAKLEKNPTYIEKLHMNDIESEPIESLRTVSDRDFSFVHYAMQNRIPRKERLPKKENGNYSKSKWVASEHSAKLPFGLLYCKACGGKMVGAYNMKKAPNCVVHYPVYRCYRGSIKARRTENKQYSHTASRMENAVLTLVKSRFAKQKPGTSRGHKRKHPRSAAALFFLLTLAAAIWYRMPERCLPGFL